MTGWKQGSERDTAGAALGLGAVAAVGALAGEPLMSIGCALAAMLAISALPRETLRPRLAPIPVRAPRNRGA